MLHQQTTPEVAAAPVHLSPLRRHWRPLLRAAGIAVAGLAIAAWSGPLEPYRMWFCLWLAGLVAFVASFPTASRQYRFPSWGALLWLLAILTVAVALRLPRIADIPANISIDEILPAMEAVHLVRDNPVNVFSSVGWFSMPNLSFAFPAVAMQVFGASFYTQRLSSLLMGVAGLAATFLLARRLFGDMTALISTFLMAVSFWHIHNSRTGFPFVQSSFCPAMVLYLLVRARQDGSRVVLAAAGVAFGFAVQGYFPVRILLIAAPLFLLMDWLAHRTTFREVCAEAAIVGVGAILVLGPLLRSVPLETLAGRSVGVLLGRPAVLEGGEHFYHVQGLWMVFSSNLAESAQMFTNWADVCVLNRSPGGLLDNGTLAALLLGILIAVLRGGEYAWFLLLWSATAFALGTAFTDAPRASYRLAAAMPAIFILAGMGIEHLLEAASPSPRWYRRTVRVAVLLALAVWVGRENYRAFFIRYATGDGHETAGSMELRFMGEHCDGRTFYAFGSGPQGSETELFCGNLRTLNRGQLPGRVDVTRPATFLVGDWQRQWLENLRACYPEAAYTTHTARDGHMLFTSVEVPILQLIAPRAGCAG